MKAVHRIRASDMGWVRNLLLLQLVLVVFLSPSMAKSVDEQNNNAKSMLRRKESSDAVIKPPFRPPPLRLRIEVEGVIYCRSCKLPGYDKLLDASPLPGAIAELRCNSRKYSLKLNGTTDSAGYFLIQAPATKVTTFGSHKCGVFLVSSPLASCNRPTDLDGGVAGATLRFERIIKVGPEQSALFAAGFLEFAPADATMCPQLP